MEIWKNIEWTGGQFQISNLGRVKRLARVNNYGRRVKEMIIRPNTTIGYSRVDFAFKGERKVILVHRLIAEAFIPNPENKPMVNHIDGNKLNNKIENLEWCTRSENGKHAVSLNLVKVPGLKGESHPSVKLTEIEVLEIFHSREEGLLLAQKYGVNRGTIYRIKNKNTWKHLLATV